MVIVRGSPSKFLRLRNDALDQFRLRDISSVLVLIAAGIFVFEVLEACLLIRLYEQFAL